MHFLEIKEKLHDAILNSIEFSWIKGEVYIKFTLNEINSLKGKNLLISSTDVIDLQIPRYCEWGGSIFVNDISLSDNNVLKIEMQSGDKIIINGENYSYQITTKVSNV